MVLTPIEVEVEYKKNVGDLQKRDIEALQDWMGKQPHLPQITELELILFLHSCYYRMELTKTTIDYYYTIRTHCPEFFTRRGGQIKSVKDAMDIIVYSPLTLATPEGFKVIFIKFIDCDPSRYSYADGVKIFCMVVDLWLLEEGTANGHVIVFDMDGVSFGHVTKLNPITMKKFLMYLQDALPFRLKGLHFVNVVPFMDKILAIMKPFMKKELNEVMYFHQKVDDSFFKHVPQKCLPSDYGGSEESIQTLHEKIKTKLCANYQWFIDDEMNHRVNETRRPGKAKNAGDLFGMEGTFKKLDID